MVKHSANTPRCGSGDDHVTCAQCSVLDEHRSDRTSVSIQLSFNDESYSRPIGICFELRQLCDKQDHFKQLFDAGLLKSRYLNGYRVASPILGQQSVIGKLLFDPIGIGSWTVGFVDGYDNRHISCLGMVNGFQGLRHDTIVRSDDQDGQVGDLSSAGPHGGKRLVSGCVQERDKLIVLFDLVGTGVLCYASGFPLRYV